MCELLDHVLISINETKFNMGLVKKTLNSQTKFNLAVACFAIVTTAYIHVVNERMSAMEKELDDIKNKMEEGTDWA